jgi:hypothetical protein
MNQFWNTWSVEGFIAEGLQPAELGWGTHETWFPENGAVSNTAAGGDLPLQPGAEHPRAQLVPDGRAQFGFLVTHNEAISIADYYTSARATRPSTGRPATMPTTPATSRCSALHEMFGRGGRAAEAPHPRRARDRGRHRRTRRAAVRPRAERLLVRLAAVGRGGPGPRALPERHRPAGQLGGAGRHGLGARKPGMPGSSRPTRWTMALPRGAKALSRPGGRRLHRLDAAQRSLAASSPRTSTKAIPGSSATSWPRPGGTARTCATCRR